MPCVLSGVKGGKESGNNVNTNIFSESHFKKDSLQKLDFKVQQYPYNFSIKVKNRFGCT